MIITIGGLAGSGTTTTAEVLSKQLDIPYISAGDIFRQMAAESGMSIIEFSKYAEGNTQIDIDIDKRQSEIAKGSDNLILEGRLSAFFVDADLKIWLTAPLDVRSERICNRESKTLKEAIDEILIREKSEAQRYKEIHNIDINDLNVYDLIVNTNRFNPESIAKIILTTLKVI